MTEARSVSTGTSPCAAPRACPSRCRCRPTTPPCRPSTASPRSSRSGRGSLCSVSESISPRCSGTCTRSCPCTCTARSSRGSGLCPPDGTTAPCPRPSHGCRGRPLRSWPAALADRRYRVPFLLVAVSSSVRKKNFRKGTLTHAEICAVQELRYRPK